MTNLTVTDLQELFGADTPLQNPRPEAAGFGVPSGVPSNSGKATTRTTSREVSEVVPTSQEVAEAGNTQELRPTGNQTTTTTTSQEVAQKGMHQEKSMTNSETGSEQVAQEQVEVFIIPMPDEFANDGTLYANTKAAEIVGTDESNIRKTWRPAIEEAFQFSPVPVVRLDTSRKTPVPRLTAFGIECLKQYKRANESGRVQEFIEQAQALFPDPALSTSQEVVDVEIMEDPGSNGSRNQEQEKGGALATLLPADDDDGEYGLTFIDSAAGSILEILEVKTTQIETARNRRQQNSDQFAAIRQQAARVRARLDFAEQQAAYEDELARLQGQASAEQVAALLSELSEEDAAALLASLKQKGGQSGKS